MKASNRTLHFLAFGAGADNPGAAQRIASQAKATRLFSSVSLVTGDEIFSHWPEFAVHRSFIEKNARGWGYWIWKPFLIKTCLEGIKDGEALVYFDAGCEILPQNSKRLARLLDHLNSHDQMLWNYAEYPIFNTIFWTKQNLLDSATREFGLNNLPRIPQVWAGNVGFVKTRKNLALADDWYRLATADNYSLLDDTPSSAPQIFPFFEHRRDQSILSLLVAAYGIKRSGSAFNYCYGEPHVKLWPILLDKPFLAMRNRSPVSQIEPIQRSLTTALRRYLQRLASKMPYYEQEPLIGWSQDRAESLTSKYRDELITLDLM